MSLKELPADGIIESEVTVIKDWLDYNEHMNVAYYVAAFDLGIDALKDVVGITLDYIENEQRSTVALEGHITYQREASLGDALTIKTRVLDFDGKRCHYYQEMYRGDELLSTQESLSISFDTNARKTCPFEPQFAERYAELCKRQKSLPIPKWVGKSVAIKRK